MHVPDLRRIVETYVVVPSTEPFAYYEQLRRDIAPQLRDLHSSGRIRWFSFLLHRAHQLTPPEDFDDYIVHVRLEPASDLDPASLGTLLPSHFKNPHHVPPLSVIAGLDGRGLRDEDWAHAWWVFGEASAWVLSLLESYREGPPAGDVFQYLHFMTNPLLLGGQSVHAPTSRHF